MSQFHRHEPELAELMEDFALLGRAVALPSERPDGAEDQERLEEDDE